MLKRTLTSAVFGAVALAFVAPVSASAASLDAQIATVPAAVVDQYYEHARERHERHVIHRMIRHERHMMHRMMRHERRERRYHRWLRHHDHM